MRKEWYGQTINDMNSSKNTFYPKMYRKVGLKMKNSSYLKNMAMLVLYNSILLRGIDTRMLISGHFLFKKFPHREEFSTIITPNVGYRNMELCLDK